MPRELARLLFCLGLSLLSAQRGYCADPAAVEPKPSFRTASGFSRFLQKYSGLTWVTNTVGSAVASAVLTAKMGGFVQARVRTYSFTDLLDGEFKSVDVKFSGSKYQGVPFGRLHLSTNGPFKLRYFQRKGHNSGLRTPLLVSIDGQVGERDLGRALQSQKVASGLRFLKLDLPGLGEQRLQILEPKVELAGDKVHVRSWLVTAGGAPDTGIPLDVVATPRLEGERFVMLKDMKVSSTAIVEPGEFARFAEELLNPLVDFGRMDRFTHAVRFSKLDVGGEHVTFAGRLLLAPKPTGKPQFSAPFEMAQKNAGTPGK